MDGITRFSLELCKQLKQQNVSFGIVIPKWLCYDNPESFHLIRYGNLKSHFWEQMDLPRFLNKEGMPFLINLSGIGPLWYKKQIITIHDLSFYVNGKWFSKAYTIFYSFATPIVARNSLAILTVSEFSKNEIVKYLKVNASKISVINNAASGYFEKSLQRLPQPVTDEKYILAVSSHDPRKNLQRLINVFLQNDMEGFKLILVGGGANHFNVRLSGYSENIIYKGFVEDQELLSLYENCFLFVYPSLYEGFGIPPLEAMKNNCAVVASDIPSLREVCGDAAIYIDPYSEQSIKEGIFRIIKDSSMKIELQEKGKIRSTLFNWEKSGKELYSVINTLLRIDL